MQGKPKVQISAFGISPAPTRLPFEVNHTGSELSELEERLKSLPGETKVIMECTGTYYLPVAYQLHEEGLTVCAVHTGLVHSYGNNTIRKVKNDKADSLKIANYGLTNWLELPAYIPEDDIRHMLKAYSRQYSKIHQTQNYAPVHVVKVC